MFYLLQPPQDELVTYAGSMANFNPEASSERNGTHVVGEKEGDENGIKSRIIMVSTQKRTILGCDSCHNGTQC